MSDLEKAKELFLSFGYVEVLEPSIKICKSNKKEMYIKYKDKYTILYLAEEKIKYFLCFYFNLDGSYNGQSAYMDI